jgi:hypothetical protein
MENYVAYSLCRRFNGKVSFLSFVLLWDKDINIVCFLVNLIVNVIKKPDCFRTTNFILLIVLCWMTVFRLYLYTKLNDRKKITTQYFFSLALRTKNNFYTFTTTQPFVCNTLYMRRGSKEFASSFASFQKSKTIVTI